MKLKHLFQIFVLLAMLCATVASSGSVQAQEGTAVVVVIRELTYWDATFTGFVSPQRYENWPVVFSEPQDFVVTATPQAEGLTALILLLDGAGVELARGTGTLTSTQPAGNYSIQVQPDTGNGFYSLTLRQVDQDQPQDESSVATVVDPASVDVGGTAAVTADLSNVPAEGFTSAEFTCTYDAAVVEVSNIVATSLFGADSAVALHGPQDGSFIVAIAGSNGNKAAAAGSALAFNVKGLQAGQTAIECKARVSKGDNALTDLPSTPASLTVNDAAAQGTLTGQAVAGKPATISLYQAENSLVKSAAAGADGTFSLTAPAGTYTVVATASGYLNAQGSATLTAGGTATKPVVSLVAGDIDGNGVIDQFDAMTIGMSYNTAAPAAADLNNDGTINVLDLEILAANYRKSGALAWD